MSEKKESLGRRLLRRLKLDRVDLVPAGASPGADIRLFKREKEGGKGPSDHKSTVAPMPEKEEKVAETTEKSPEELQAELDETKQKLEAAESELDETKGKLEGTSEAEVESLKSKLEEKEQELAKAKGEPNVQKELDEAKDEIEKLRKAERRRTFVEKAKAFEKVGPPEKIAPLLEAADEHFSEEDQDTLSKLLKGAVEQIEKGALFAQLADVDAEAEDFETKLEKRAKERVEKSDEKLTIEQAKVEIMREDPDLRRAYQEERAS
jgi:chromosome segregation ATPase